MNQTGLENPSTSGVPTDEVYPLTPFQTAIYLAEQFGDRHSSYHIPVGLRVEGQIDLASMRTALEQVTRRHTILRATISLNSGRLVQRLDLDRSLPWEARDYSRETDVEAAAESSIREFAAQPFNLADQLPLRVALLTFREDRHLILLVIHHVVFDGWSRQLLVRDLIQEYEWLTSGKAGRLPLRQRQYVDYALERAGERSNEMARAHSSHLQELLRTPDVLLPTDKPRRPAPDFRSDSIPLSLAGEILGRLRDFERSERLTSFVFFLAIFNLLLHLRAGRDGIRIAFPVNCRDRSEDMEVIGCFVNTLLFKVPIDLNQSVLDYLRCVRAAVMQLLPFREHPLQLTSLDSTHEAGYGLHTLYRVMFAFQERMPDGYTGKKFQIEPFVLHGERTKCDLTLLLDDDGRSVTGAIEYRTDLFHRSTIEGMRRKYLGLVHQALIRPHGRLRDLLGQDIVAETLGQPKQRPCWATDGWTTVPEQISDWAQRVPDRVVVASRQGSLTFAGLDRLANRWCEALRTLGVGVEDRVGVAIDLGIAAFPAMLAIWRAGAAYVPLDLDGPRARLTRQIQSSAMSWIVCTDRRSEEPLGDAQMLSVSSMSLRCPEPTTSCMVPPVETLAYILYTSGSSGVPKGVMITHRGLSNYLSWCAVHYRMHEAPTLMHTSLLSDMTITTMWGPLVAGQRVCLEEGSPGIEGLRDGLSLGQEFAVVKMTPSHLRILSHEPERFGRPSICKTCVLGGETLHWKDVEAYMGLGMRLVNEYGPTETVVGSLVYDIEEVRRDGAVPVGVPLSETTVHLLNKRHTTVSSGTAGEIHLGGTGVARGYERQAALTAASFLPDESSVTSGARMYRTGDLGVRLGDGNIQFLGRGDDQMKVHGFRVERGEVEAAIAAHPNVLHAVALQDEDTGLLAHVEIVSGQTLSVRELQDFLKQQLPSHMIPRLFRFLKGMPLLANGKVDRRRVLEEERRLVSDRAQDRSLPQSQELEQRILAVWKDVLDHDALDPSDHFFDVGGDSVRLYMVYRRLVDMTGQEFPAVALFEFPTARSCAQYLRALNSGISDPIAHLAQPDPINGERERLLALNALLRSN